MGMGMERPLPVYQDPGPDAQPETLDMVARKFLAMVGADRQLDPGEVKTIQWMMAGLQAIAAQKAAPTEMAPPSDETSEYGSGEGVSPVEEQTAPGAEYL